MKADDMRRIRGLTWVGWLNTLVLQWLCVRLAYLVDTDGPRNGERTGWGYCFAWPLAHRVGRFRRL